jgi:L-lactate utilization protein LutC
MGLKNKRELQTTKQKLRILEARLEAARREPSDNPRAHELSQQSLRRMCNQLKEEIARFETQTVLK